MRRGHPETEDEKQRRFGIKPGAKLSKDPDAKPQTEECDICGGQHPARHAGGGD